MRIGSAVVLCVTFSMTGCAAIVTGVNQPIAVDTRMDGVSFPGAACKLSSNKGEWFVTTPGSVVVHRGFQNLLVECAKDGVAPAIASIPSSTKALAFGNILFGGAIGVGVDVGTGAAYDYPALITIEMGRAGATGVIAAPPPPSAAAPLSVVATADPAPPTVQGAAPSPYEAPAPAPVVLPRGRELRYQFSAEAFARERSCSSTPRAVLVAYGPGSETYLVSCSTGQPLVARCDYGTCREIR